MMTQILLLRGRMIAANFWLQYSKVTPLAGGV